MDDEGKHPNGVFPVDVTGQVEFFHKIDRKIESLLEDLNDGSYSSKMIQDCTELNSVHRGLRHRFDRILEMYTLEEINDHLMVYTKNRLDFVVMESTVRFFERKLHNMDKRARRLLYSKTNELIEFFLKETSEEAPSSSTSTRVGKTKTTTGTDNEELTQSSSESGEDTVPARFTVDLGVLFVPRTTFAHRLGQPEVSDDDWKLVEAISAESTNIIIKLSLLLAELYIQLLPRDNTEGMSDVYKFLGNLKELSKENPNRDIVKWMRKVCKVAYDQNSDLEGSEKRQQAKSEALEVKILLKKFMDSILALETVNDFSDLRESMTVTGAVKELEDNLRSVRFDLDEMETFMTERRDRKL